MNKSCRFHHVCGSFLSFPPGPYPGYKPRVSPLFSFLNFCQAGPQSAKAGLQWQGGVSELRMRSCLAPGLGGRRGVWSVAGAKFRDLWVAPKPTGFPPLDFKGAWPWAGCDSLTLLRGQFGSTGTWDQAEMSKRLLYSTRFCFRFCFPSPPPNVSSLISPQQEKGWNGLVVNSSPQPFCPLEGQLSWVLVQGRVAGVKAWMV